MKRTLACECSPRRPRSAFPQAGYEEDLGRNCAVMSAPSLVIRADEGGTQCSYAAATASGASGASPAGMISGNGLSPAGISQGWRVAGVRAGQWFDAPGLRCVTPETLR